MTCSLVGKISPFLLQKRITLINIAAMCPRAYTILSCDYHMIHYDSLHSGSGADLAGERIPIFFIRFDPSAFDLNEKIDHTCIKNI